MKKRGAVLMKTKADGKTLACLLLALLILVCCIQIGMKPNSNGSDNPDQEPIYGDGWGITGVRGARSSMITHINGTDELIYFTYNGKPYIDAYDLSGEYQYTIQLPDARNGAVSIDCRDGILIADSKDNGIYLFQGTELLERMDYDEARQRGLIPVWGSTDSEYRLTRTHVVRADGEELFELPVELAKNMNRRLTLSEDQLKIENWLILIGFAVLWVSGVGFCLWRFIQGIRENWRK